MQRILEKCVKNPGLKIVNLSAKADGAVTALPQKKRYFHFLVIDARKFNIDFFQGITRLNIQSPRLNVP